MLLFLYTKIFFKKIQLEFYDHVLRRWSLLNRYILKEVAISQISALLFLYFILLINNFLVMAETLLSLNVGIFQIIGLIISLTPSTLIWALPFSGLIGSLLAIGRLAADNELLAASFLGCAYRRLLKPFLTYGTILTTFSFLLLNIIAPQADKLFEHIIKNIAQSSPNVLIESNSSQKVGDTLVMTGPIKEGRVEGLTIIDLDSMGYKRVIHAKSARLQTQSKKGVRGLAFRLDEVQGISADNNPKQLDYQLIYATAAEYGMTINPRDLHKMTTASGKTLKSTWVGLENSEAQLMKNRALRMEQAKNWLGNLSDNYTSAVLNPNENFRLDVFYTRYINTLPSKSPDTRFRTSFIDFYQQISLPIACFIFVFLAFSLAITSRKTQQTTMLGVGVVFSMTYWFSLYMTIHMVIIGQLPLWIATAADLVFLLLALVLLLRIKK